MKPNSAMTPLFGSRRIEGLSDWCGNLHALGSPENRDCIIDQFTHFPQLHQAIFQVGYETDTK